jgi:signal transduction histidine kinase
MVAAKNIDPGEARLLKAAAVNESALNHQAARRNRAHRMISGAVLGLVASYWAGPVVAAIWYGVFFIFEMVCSPWLVKNLVAPCRGEPRGMFVRACIAFLTTAISTFIWTYAWVKGGVEAGVIAGFGFANTALFVMAYMYNFRPGLIVAVATATVGIIIGASANGANWVTLIAITLAGHTMARALLGVSDRNRIHRLLVISQDKQKEAERASLEKSRFLATMSHELRTPLNAIIGYAEILQEDLEARNETQSVADAKNIRRAAGHLIGVISDVLDFSKLEAGRLDVRLAPVDLSVLIGDVAETLRPLAAKSGNRIVAVVKPGISLVSDEAKLRQCIINLGGNACKFTKDGFITFSAHVDGEHAIIKVMDTGEGIDEQNLARVFEPFTQADDSTTRRHDGTGLGLTITRGLAQLLGGDVTANSKRGEGSTFEIRLPLRSAANDAATATPPEDDARGLAEHEPERARQQRQ